MIDYISSLLNAFDPYVSKIEDSFPRDIARILLPIVVLLFLGFIISLPFGVLTALIDGAVKVMTFSPS
jgi:hypothetical protein